MATIHTCDVCGEEMMKKQNTDLVLSCNVKQELPVDICPSCELSIQAAIIKEANRIRKANKLSDLKPEDLP